MNLSKSKYCSGVQCPKILWLMKNTPETFDESVLSESIMETGKEVYEIKGAAEYTHDIAFQYYVLTKLGYTVEKACLVYIDNQYVRQGELELEELFLITNLTKTVRAIQADVEMNLAVFAKYLSMADEPADDIGLRCFSPHKCGFWPYCTRTLPTPNVFDLAGPRKTTMLSCYYQGLISFSELYGCDQLNAKAYQQIEHELYNYPPTIKADAIRTFLSHLSYPLYFLDFESFMPAIPEFDDSRPFGQIVFQYSLHWIEREGSELKHTEFLAYPGADPRRTLAEQLCKDIPLDVCTTAYIMRYSYQEPLAS